MALKTGEDSARLEIRDTGQGFDPIAAAGKGGLGLVSMQERLRLVQGELKIESQPGGGTIVIAHVPLAAAVEESIKSNTNDSAS